MAEAAEFGCACWTNDYALGHDGHCCFLRDNRCELPHSDAWRDDEEPCEHTLAVVGADEKGGQR